MRRKLSLVGAMCLAVTPLSAHAIDLVYTGVVTAPTGAFEALTPVDTPVGGPISVDAAALAAGSIGIADITAINVNVGGFCFATDGGDCGGVGTLVPITSIDSAAITGSTGELGGSFSVTAFSPTFMVSIPISFDLDGGTFFGDGDALGTVSGTGALEAPVLVDLDYTGVVTEPTGAFEALTPVDTPVGGPLSVDSAALAAGLIEINDIAAINVNVGGFCFATPGGDCSGVGSLVPIESIDSANITGTSGVLGGSFSVTAFSPTFMVSIPITFDLDAGTFFADGDALGTVAGTGMLMAPGAVVDTDNDSVTDDIDNCTLVPNTDQLDTNGDGIGNRCDPDVNNDCIVNFIDISQFTPRFNTGTGDPNYDADFDIDGSGSLNFVDYIAFTSNFQMPPGPSANPCVPAAP